MLINNTIVFFITFANFYVVCFGDVFPQYKYYYELEGWLAVHTEPADWHTARLQCHLEGAFLASPWTLKFTDFILTRIMDDSHIFEETPQAMFSGGYFSFSEGVITFKKGKPAISMNPKDVAVMSICGTFSAQTNIVYSCDEKLPYACYKPGPEPKPTSDAKPEAIPEDIALLTASREKCGDTSSGYEFSEQTGQCYKFHAEAVETWYDAKAACEGEGAQLAIVNSDAEAQVLVKLFEKYPHEKIYDAEFKDTAAIGFLYDELSKSWKTIDGKSLEVAGYQSWRSDAPHTLAKFGFFCRDGLLYGYFSTVKGVPFICEKRISGQTQKTNSDFWNNLTYRMNSTETESEFESVTKLELGQDTETDMELKIIELSLEAACDENLGYQSIVVRGPASGWFSKKCFRVEERNIDFFYDAKEACEKNGDELAFSGIEVDNANSFTMALQLLKKYKPKSAEKFPDLDTETSILDNIAKGYSFNESMELAKQGAEVSKLHFAYIDGYMRPYISGIDNFVLFMCEKKPYEFTSETVAAFESDTETETTFTFEPEANTEFEQDLMHSGTTFESENTTLSYESSSGTAETDSSTSIESDGAEMDFSANVEYDRAETDSSSYVESDTAATDTSVIMEADTSEPTNLVDRPRFLTGPSCQYLDYEYFEETGFCYKFHAQKHDESDILSRHYTYTSMYIQADAFCRHEKSMLVYVRTGKEAKVLISLYEKYVQNERVDGYPSTAIIGRYSKSDLYDEYRVYPVVIGEWRVQPLHSRTILGFFCRHLPIR